MKHLEQQAIEFYSFHNPDGSGAVDVRFLGTVSSVEDAYLFVLGMAIGGGTLDRPFHRGWAEQLARGKRWPFSHAAHAALSYYLIGSVPPGLYLPPKFKADKTLYADYDPIAGF